jgi:hypothetical protein
MVRLQTEVPQEFVERWEKRLPASDSMSDAELLRFIMQYADRQWELEQQRAESEQF